MAAFGRWQRCPRSSRVSVSGDWWLWRTSYLEPPPHLLFYIRCATGAHQSCKIGRPRSERESRPLHTHGMAATQRMKMYSDYLLIHLFLPGKGSQLFTDWISCFEIGVIYLFTDDWIRFILRAARSSWAHQHLDDADY